ncbi:hypothetical protein [Calothrix rhizosoleniae]|uniref:hypothetical protein n=1 Tax=Calothrix rhizosoleniae TaxID=888997 RepID=UPI000B4972D9|nr:hypothetical protein [Calothrix rhizosoleniae]
MSIWQKYIFLTPISLSAALWIAGCSETRVSQCQRLIKLVDQGNSLIEKDKGYQVTTSLQLAKDLEKVTKSLKKTNFKDPKLVDFQTKFTKIFGTLNQQIAKAGKALGATKAAKASLDGRIKIQKAKEQIDAHLTAAKSTGKSFDTLFKQLNEYCNVPENITQK